MKKEILIGLMLVLGTAMGFAQDGDARHQFADDEEPVVCR